MCYALARYEARVGQLPARLPHLPKENVWGCPRLRVALMLRARTAFSGILLLLSFLICPRPPVTKMTRHAVNFDSLIGYDVGHDPGVKLCVAAVALRLDPNTVTDLVKFFLGATDTKLTDGIYALQSHAVAVNHVARCCGGR